MLWSHEFYQWMGLSHPNNHLISKKYSEKLLKISLKIPVMEPSYVILKGNIRCIFERGLIRYILFLPDRLRHCFEFGNQSLAFIDSIGTTYPAVKVKSWKITAHNIWKAFVFKSMFWKVQSKLNTSTECFSRILFEI